MKTLLLFLAIALFFVGALVSAAPLTAAPYSPPQGSVVSIMDQQPTPTPSVSSPNEPIDCSFGC